MEVDVAGSEDQKLHDFLVHLDTERRSSIHTVRAYRMEIERLIAAIGADGGTDWVAVSTDDLRRFLADRSEKVGRRTMGRTIWPEPRATAGSARGVGRSSLRAGLGVCERIVSRGGEKAGSRRVEAAGSKRWGGVGRRSGRRWV